jgi:hypothetical protein
VRFATLAYGMRRLRRDELTAIIYRHRAELAARGEGDSSPTPPATSEQTSISGSSTLPALDSPDAAIPLNRSAALDPRDSFH